jgi:DNA-binding MarR family transcriptional regulator
VIRYNLIVNEVSKKTVQQRLQTLAEFRYALRQFLHFSEEAAAKAGLHPQQHQLLLQIAGIPHGVAPTISYAAERLGLRHHTAVELSKRCEQQGLIRRTQNTHDRRYVELQVTSQGRQLLQSLSEDHAHELYELAPRLIAALTQIRAYPGTRDRGWRVDARELGVPDEV